MRFKLARSTQAIELEFAAPLAQHALSPANALDAQSIAATTKAEAVILIMMKAEIAARVKPFKLFLSVTQTTG